MKRKFLTKLSYVLCALALFLASFPFGGFFRARKYRVSAQPIVGDYACILQADTFFYATPAETQGLFLLPQSYYVKLLDYGEGYCRVEYLTDDKESQRVVGYVKTTALTFVDYLPKRPYFFYQFELRYRIEESALPNDDFLNEITLLCTYYGDYNVGSKTYCYVLRDGSFGYVPKPDDLSVPENTEYADYIAQKETAPSPQPTEEDSPSSPAQIAILIALCLLVPILAAFILKPPRRPPYETE